jgi:hypothetical protein
LGALSAAELRAEIARARPAADAEPKREYVAALEQLAGERAGRERVVREFRELAEERAVRPGTTQLSPEWEAAPARLRDLVDRFNREGPEGREGFLERLSRDPEKAALIDRDLEVRRELVRERERTLDRDLDHGPEL